MPARDASPSRLLCPILGAAVALLAACAQITPRNLQDAGHSHLPRSVEVEADWDDVPAVVAGIVPRVELVADPPTVHTDRIYRCRVYSSQHGPGWLEFERLEDGFIRIDAHIGRFGHPDEEHWVEQAMAERFSQIRGDTAAPIRVPPRPR